MKGKYFKEVSRKLPKNERTTRLGQEYLRLMITGASAAAFIWERAKREDYCLRLRERMAAITNDPDYRQAEPYGA